MIQGHGNNSPLVMIIEDHAHGEDFKTNKAISGSTERVLRGLCHEANLNFDTYWKTALIKDEPAITLQLAKKSKTYLEENQPKIQQFSSVINEEIQDLKPNLIIPLGELSFNYLTALHGIRKFRGSVLPVDPNHKFKQNTKVLPILGPYPYLNQEYKLKYISQIDFNKVPRYIHDSPLPDNQYNIWVARSANALRNFLERSYSDDGFLVFDIETFYGVITCISFCFDGYESVCVPFIDPSIDLDNRVLMMRMVAKILDSPIAKGNQNIKFDWKRLEQWGFRVRNVKEDTLLKFAALYPEFPKNLGFQTSIYTDLPYFKDEGKEWDPFKFKKDRVYLYNAKDSLATWQICKAQDKDVAELEVRPIYEQSIKLLPIYKRSEQLGIRIDDLRRHKLLAKYESLYDTEVYKLRSLTGIRDLNPLSSKQISDLVYNQLKYHKHPEAKPTTDEEHLELLSAMGTCDSDEGPQILRSVINSRKLHKVLELLNLELFPDGRFRCEWNLAGTETGRTSGGQTTHYAFLEKPNGKIVLKKLGHSLQTIGKHGFSIDGDTYGKDIRSIFVPSHGYIFVEIDQSGAEARVDRVLSGNFDLSVFDNPGIHRLTGSWIYDCPPEEIKKHVLVNGVDRYHMSKTVRHAGERNMRTDRLVLMTQRPYAECDAILRKFHQFQPEIRQVFHREIKHCIDEYRCLVAPNGRRRDFFDRIDHKTYNEGISFLPQAIVADQTKLAILGSTNEVGYAEMLVEAHDGVLWELPKGKEHEFYKIYDSYIRKPINFSTGSLKREYSLVIPTECEVGETWYDLKPLKS